MNNLIKSLIILQVLQSEKEKYYEYIDSSSFHFFL